MNSLLSAFYAGRRGVLAVEYERFIGHKLGYMEEWSHLNGWLYREQMLVGKFGVGRFRTPSLSERTDSITDMHGSMVEYCIGGVRRPFPPVGVDWVSMCGEIGQWQGVKIIRAK